MIDEDEILHQANELMSKLFEEREKIRKNKRPHILDILMEEHAVLGYQIMLMQSVDKALTAGSYAKCQAGLGLLEATVIQIKTFMGWEK